MAAKKPAASTKKTVKATKSAPRKVVPIKKASAKKTATKKSPVKHAKSKAVATRSFRLSPETESFISSRITIQTIYWSILSTVILVVGILILNAQLDILDTLNQISEGI